MNLFAETVDDGVDAVELLLEFADSTLVRLITTTQLVALSLGTLVRFRQLTHLTLDRLKASTHRLQNIPAISR